MENENMITLQAPRMPSKRTPEAPPAKPASIEPVRFETTLSGKKHKHRVETDVFLQGFGIRRIDELVSIHMEVVDITMPRPTLRDFLNKGLHMLDPEDQWAIIEPILHDLQRQGYTFREE